MYIFFGGGRGSGGGGSQLAERSTAELWPVKNKCANQINVSLIRWKLPFSVHVGSLSWNISGIK